jgi:hypothetical protein
MGPLSSAQTGRVLPHSILPAHRAATVAIVGQIEAGRPKGPDMARLQLVAVRDGPRLKQDNARHRAPLEDALDPGHAVVGAALRGPRQADVLAEALLQRFFGAPPRRLPGLSDVADVLWLVGLGEAIDVHRPLGCRRDARWCERGRAAQP